MSCFRNELDSSLRWPRVTQALLSGAVLGAGDPRRSLIYGTLGRHLVGSCGVLSASQWCLPRYLTRPTGNEQLSLCFWVELYHYEWMCYNRLALQCSTLPRLHNRWLAKAAITSSIIGGTESYMNNVGEIGSNRVI